MWQLVPIRDAEVNFPSDPTLRHSALAVAASLPHMPPPKFSHLGTQGEHREHGGVFFLLRSLELSVTSYRNISIFSIESQNLKILVVHATSVDKLYKCRL